MKLANAELSKQLFDITHWEPPFFTFVDGEYTEVHYDLGFLVDRLPKRDNDITHTAMLGRATDNNGWSVVYDEHAYLAAEPADAVCKLLIAVHGKHSQ